MDHTLLDKEIIVWGTGQKAGFFMQELKKYDYYIQLLYNRSLIDNICYFVDSDDLKVGKDFCDKKIRHSNVLFEQGEGKIIIIGVLDSSEIVETLRLQGHNINKCIFIYQEFLKKIKINLVENIFCVLENLYKIYTLDMENLEMDLYIKKIQALYNEIKNIKNIRGGIYKELLLNAILSNAFIRWEKSNKKQYFFEKLRQYFFDQELIAAMAFYYEKDLELVADFFCEKRILNNNLPETKKIKTIGIYDERYYNGGGQKFLSLIIPVYIKIGYQVVFFTDEFNPEEEYPLPPEVVRIILKNKYGNNVRARLTELFKYIQIYHVDIMCYHNCYLEECFFYEMLFLKLKQVPVLLELHLTFIDIMTRKNGLADFYHKIYGLADKVIVLSKENEDLWRALNVNAVYIPNPIEKGNERLAIEIPFNKRNGNTLLWIGRIDQKDKRIFDAVYIMELVVKKLSCAKLKIVGSTTNQHLLLKLKNLIKEKNLGENIQLCGYHTDVTEFYQDADVMLMTSRVESFSLVIAESKVWGVPLVLYDLPYLEMLQEKKGYINVQQEDYHAAANALLKVLKNEKERHRMAVEARESIRPFVEYDIGIAWKKIFDEINSI